MRARQNMCALPRDRCPDARARGAEQCKTGAAIDATVASAAPSHITGRVAPASGKGFVPASRAVPAAPRCDRRASP